MPIFRPTPLSWDDVKDGKGEEILQEIEEFISSYCYSDEPLDFGGDEELANDLAFFSETWEYLCYGSGRRFVVDHKQITAILSLIHGAFYTSYAADELKDKLANSAKKTYLIEMLTHVTSFFCQYITLKCRLENECNR